MPLTSAMSILGQLAFHGQHGGKVVNLYSWGLEVNSLNIKLYNFLAV